MLAAVDSITLNLFSCLNLVFFSISQSVYLSVYLSATLYVYLSLLTYHKRLYHNATNALKAHYENCFWALFCCPNVFRLAHANMKLIQTQKVLLNK